MLKLAIVGCGWAGTRHLEAVRELGDKVEAAGLVDSDEAHLQKKAAEFGIQKAYANYAGALQDSEFDAVDICSPHRFHCEQAVAAAEAGKHVLVEKPMALTVAEATRMMEASAASGVRLYVAESAVYTPLAGFLREVVKTGRYVGELVAASLASGFRAETFGYAGRRAWLARPELGGTGTWMLHGIHSVAQLRYIFGEVASVYLRERRAASAKPADSEGTMFGLLTMDIGLPVSILQSREARLKAPLGGYLLHGDRGSLRASADGGCRVWPAEGEPFEVALPSSSLSEYALELSAFADYVAGAPGPTDGASERRSLAVVEAGYESAATGEKVELKKRFGELAGIE